MRVIAEGYVKVTPMRGGCGVSVVRKVTRRSHQGVARGGLSRRGGGAEGHAKVMPMRGAELE